MVSSLLSMSNHKKYRSITSKRARIICFRARFYVSELEFLFPSSNFYFRGRIFFFRVELSRLLHTSSDLIRLELENHNVLSTNLQKITHFYPQPPTLTQPKLQNFTKMPIKMGDVGGGSLSLTPLPNPSC